MALAVMLHFARTRKRVTRRAARVALRIGRPLTEAERSALFNSHFRGDEYGSPFALRIYLRREEVSE